VACSGHDAGMMQAVLKLQAGYSHSGTKFNYNVER